MSAISQDIPVLTVSQLTNAIKQNLESTFPSIWLQGEVSNCKLHSSGHLYFSIKDAGAQISAVMFRGSVSKMKAIPKDGDKIIAYGNLNVYPPSGRYQIVVQEMRLAGLGELLLKLEELKQKLHKKGWFSKSHKKPIPKFPRKIGVVTSPTGAAVQDIINVLTRRFSGFHLILNPVKVQGEGAAEEISHAIKQFNEHELVDVMIVGRGGGSIEDLWAFNEEIVAEAIFSSHIPIIAAVGHETDHCIAEYVADARAPTPSAAAELVIAEKAQQVHLLNQLERRFQQTVHHLLKQNHNLMEGILKHPIFRSPYAILGPWMQKLDDLRQSIDLSTKQTCKQKEELIGMRGKLLQSLNPTTQIINFKQKLRSLSKQLDNNVKSYVSLNKERLEHISSSLRTIDPKNLLKKGYSILFSEKERSVITSVHELGKHQKLRTLLSDGEVASQIEEIYPREQ